MMMMMILIPCCSQVIICLIFLCLRGLVTAVLYQFYWASESLEFPSILVRKEKASYFWTPLCSVPLLGYSSPCQHCPSWMLVHPTEKWVLRGCTRWLRAACLPLTAEGLLPGKLIALSWCLSRHKIMESHLKHLDNSQSCSFLGGQSHVFQFASWDLLMILWKTLDRCCWVHMRHWVGYSCSEFLSFCWLFCSKISMSSQGEKLRMFTPAAFPVTWLCC